MYDDRYLELVSSRSVHGLGQNQVVYLTFLLQSTLQDTIVVNRTYRRTILRAVGAGATVALAGCSGSERDEPGNEENGAEDGENEATETQETEPQFSTDGTDSELIGMSADELPLLTVSDLPEGEWEINSESSSEIRFERDSEPNVRTFVEASAYVNESVPEAKSNYSGFMSEYTRGRYENIRSLDIAVKSDVLQMSRETSKQTWIVFRDANAMGTVLRWNAATEEGTNVPQPSWEETAELAVTLHQKWR